MLELSMQYDAELAGYKGKNKLAEERNMIRDLLLLGENQKIRRISLKVKGNGKKRVKEYMESKSVDYDRVLIDRHNAELLKMKYEGTTNDGGPASKVRSESKEQGTPKEPGGRKGKYHPAR